MRIRLGNYKLEIYKAYGYSGAHFTSLVRVKTRAHDSKVFFILKHI